MLDYLTKDDLPEGVIDVVDVIGMDAFKSLVKFAVEAKVVVTDTTAYDLEL